MSSGAAETAMNAVSNVATGTANAAASIFNTVTNAASNVVNAAGNAASNVPFLNSLVSSNATGPKNGNNASKNSGFNMFNSLTGSNANKPANANANKPANANANKPANANANKPANANANKPANANYGNAANAANAGNSGSSLASYGMYIFIALILTFLVVFSLFSQQIQLGYQYVESNIRAFLNMSVPPSVTAAVAPAPVAPVTVPAQAPQDTTPKEATVPQPSQKSIVEKVLPASGNEVFNVAQNKFTYYDAEPLCNALGAELATYEQVKAAWADGADWCNYGWVKGQMAVYPTQKATYDKLQMGPADQRNVCGTVGINGGYFDNPEFKYGVNCYGQKPDQSAHDQAMLMAQGKAPKTPDTLKIDELKAEFKQEADALFVKPFNDQKWDE